MTRTAPAAALCGAQLLALLMRYMHLLSNLLELLLPRIEEGNAEAKRLLTFTSLPQLLQPTLRTVRMCLRLNGPKDSQLVRPILNSSPLIAVLGKLHELQLAALTTAAGAPRLLHQHLRVSRGWDTAAATSAASCVALALRLAFFD